MGRSGSASPRNPRFPIVHFDLQTAFRARVSIFKSGISGSEWHTPVSDRLFSRTATNR